MTQDIQSINELKSYTEYNVSTPTSVFTIGFQYQYNVDVVNVYVDGVEATAAGYDIQHDSHGTITLEPAVHSGVVRLQRETDIDTSAHSFSAGAKFTAGNMDENFEQIRHSQQEVRDGFSKLSTDTYEIIDTLQEVGEMAQEAADAAEQAAQTANDAAAQVNDKISYQDLDDAVDSAIAATQHNNFAGRDVADAHPASAILDGSGLNQQQLNDSILTEIANIKSTENKLDPRNFGVVGDGVTDDSDALDDLISYMQSIAKMDERWFNMQGCGVDFSGLTCLISRPLNLSGFSNYTLVSTSFIAAPSFTGDALILVAKYNPAQWHNHNITFIEPYLDCAWNCNYGLMLTDYIQVKIIGGYITQYRKKGINAVKSGAYSHELNLIGTFIFQVEAGRTYPVDIVDGEAWFVDSPDNNFTAVVVGPQKVACATATAGPSHYTNCHFYPATKKLYGSTSDHFVGCYFDGCEIVLGPRTTVIGCLFVVLDGGFALTFPNDNFAIRVQSNQFRKLGSNTNIFNYPTLAERTSAYRPAFIDNVIDNATHFATAGKVWITGANDTQTSYTIPDMFRPLSIHNFGGWTNLAGSSSSGTVFITTELSAGQDTIIMRAYKLNASGALVAQNMSGMSFYLALNT